MHTYIFNHILANTRWRLKFRATHNSTSHLVFYIILFLNFTCKKLVRAALLWVTENPVGKRCLRILENRQLLRQLAKQINTKWFIFFRHMVHMPSIRNTRYVLIFRRHLPFHINGICCLQ